MRTAKNIFLLPLVSILCTAFFTACKPGPQIPDSREEVLVRAGEAVLTRSELDSKLPADLSPQDSVSRSRAYIRSWIESQLISAAAEKSLINSEEIDRMVEEYRRELVAREYLNRRYAELGAEGFPQDSVNSFYTSRKEMFRLERPVVRGIFMKIPAHHPGLKEIRRLIKSPKTSDIDILEKESLNSSVVYDYFRDRWTDIGKIESMFPAGEGEFDRSRLSRGANIEQTTGEYVYILNVSDFIDAGEIAPEEFADKQVRRAMEFERRRTLDRKMRRDLFLQAQNRGEIEIFCDLAQ